VRFALSALLLLAVVLPDRAPGSRTVTREEAAVLAVVERMFDGMRTRDSVKMISAFHPGARLVGMRRSSGGENKVQELTAEGFAAFVMRDTRPAWTEQLWEPEVRIRGTLATVWGAYDFHFGATFSHCGVDAIQLLQTSDGWRIVSIADTYEREGCPSRPAPAPSLW